MFIDKLIKKITLTKNPSIIGLDPRIEYVPNCIKDKIFEEKGKNLDSAAYAIWEFNKALIDSFYDLVPAIKPQLAYYEMYGLKGIETFYKTVEYAKSKDLIVVADGKRNDIGATCEAYSSAYLGKVMIDQNEEKAFDVDALTVTPYLGSDGINPFLNDCISNGKGIFVLAKTSNKSSGELQDLVLENGKKVYEVVAEYVNEWSEKSIGEYGYSNIGAVVGATYPEQAKVLRKIMSKSYILVPGYGAQGGTAKDVTYSFNKDGLGAIVNASRSVMCAYKSENYKSKYKENEFAKATRDEVIRMRDDINSYL